MTIRRFFLAWVVALSMVPLGSMSALAEGVRIESSWARASVGGTGAAFVSFVNDSGTDDRLTGVQSPVAADAMLHRSFAEGGVMKMEHVAAVPMTAGQRVEMKPGSMHVMLMGLKQPLRKGEEFPLSLRFERGGTMDVTVKVFGPGAMGPE